MNNRSSDQHVFAAALLDPAHPCPPGLRTWNNSDPAQRFRVYRNNVIVSLIDALADTFPVTQELVGEDFFRDMARNFACSHPPGSTVMAWYGAGLPEFVQDYAPAACLPYLADVARLEWLRVEACHAPDVPLMEAGKLAEALAESANGENVLAGMTFSLNPALRLLQSNYAVVSLWAAHQGVIELGTVRPETPETALILRVGLDVEIMRIPPPVALFIDEIAAGRELGAAIDETIAIDHGFDPSAILGLLIQKGAISSINLAGRAS